MTATGEAGGERVDERDRVIGVVDRGEAIANGSLHRVATTVCRDADGRIPVHRRPETMSRFPGRYNWLIGGGVEAGESYERAAAREPAEELGVRAPAVRFAFRFLCRGAISPSGSASTKPSSPTASPPTRRRSPGTPGSPRASCAT